MADLTIADVIAHLPEAFMPEKAAGIDADIQFKLTGEQAGEWVVGIHNQQCVVTQGTTPKPRLTLSANTADALAVLSGKLDGMKAFMQGKLRLTGDMNLAMRFTTLFKMT